MAKEERSLQGKVVAITGGARGIGKATAKALIGQGAKVAIGDLDLELAEKTAAELGSGTVALELDVTRRDSFEAFVDGVEERLGPIYSLINNAGIMPIGPLAEEDDATARRMVDINLHGVIYGTKIAIARLQPRGTGHIVNIASQAGKAGIPGGATYCATKHAVVGLSEAVRQELRDSGVEWGTLAARRVDEEGMAPRHRKVVEADVACRRAADPRPADRKRDHANGPLVGEDDVAVAVRQRVPGGGEPRGQLTRIRHDRKLGRRLRVRLLVPAKPPRPPALAFVCPRSDDPSRLDALDGVRHISSRWIPLASDDHNEQRAATPSESQGKKRGICGAQAAR
jgi:NADP-dependent 3-hydroxy acid dehydrogenase YdfG